MKKGKALLYGLAILPGTLFAANQQDRHPNVIYVFPDQLRNCALNFWAQPGYRDKVEFQADPTHTPNIDNFARQSVVLTSAQSNFPLSSPHRGSLLTGMYPNKSGVSLNCNSDRPNSYIRENTTCIGDVFSHAGYDCAYIGKMHTDRPEKNDPQNPGHYVEEGNPVWDAYTAPARRHGFNYWYSYGTYDVHKNPHYWDSEGHKHEPHEWSPLHEAKVAAAYIKNEGNVRDASKPFFMMVAMNPPHSPYRSDADCMPEDLALYKNKPADSLLVRPNVNLKLDKVKSAPYYFASVTGVDRAFGMILKALKDAGLDDNTIVILSSDHGETMCSHNTSDPKNSPYVEAMNIPFIVRYPKAITPRVDNLLMSSPDIMPTVLGMAGLGKDIPATVQGKDYSQLLFNGKAKVKRPDAALYIQNLNGKKNAEGKVIDYFPSARGIKTDRYTLAIFIDKKHHITRTLFFDDKKDPYQQHNLDVNANKGVYKKLFKRMTQLLKEIEDPWYTQGIVNELK